MGRGRSGRLAYGTQFRTLLQDGMVKFIERTESRSAALPDFSSIPYRIYAVVNRQNKVKFIGFYDSHGNKYKEMDVYGTAHIYRGVRYESPHIHLGRVHDEYGTRGLNEEERELLDRILRTWHNHISR